MHEGSLSMAAVHAPGPKNEGAEGGATNRLGFSPAPPSKPVPINKHKTQRNNHTLQIIRRARTDTPTYNYYKSYLVRGGL